MYCIHANTVFCTKIGTDRSLTAFTFLPFLNVFRIPLEEVLQSLRNSVDRITPNWVFFPFPLRCNRTDSTLHGFCHNQHSAQLWNTETPHDNFVPTHPAGIKISLLINFYSLWDLQRGCFGHVLDGWNLAEAFHNTNQKPGECLMGHPPSWQECLVLESCCLIWIINSTAGLKFCGVKWKERSCSTAMLYLS